MAAVREFELIVLVLKLGACFDTLSKGHMAAPVLPVIIFTILVLFFEQFVKNSKNLKE